MIESRYWRKELIKDLRDLDKLRTYKRWSEKKQVLFERKVMLIAFQIRSLLERPKVSRRVAYSKIEIVYFPATDSSPLDKALDDIDAMYDWDTGDRRELSVMQLCNQIIHYRYMFAISEGSLQFTHLIVVSDYKMSKGIFKISVDDMISLFAKFTQENSGLNHEGVSVRITWDEKSYSYIQEILEDDPGNLIDSGED